MQYVLFNNRVEGWVEPEGPMLVEANINVASIDQSISIKKEIGMLQSSTDRRHFFKRRLPLIEVNGIVGSFL